MLLSEGKVVVAVTSGTQHGGAGAFAYLRSEPIDCSSGYTSCGTALIIVYLRSFVAIDERSRYLHNVHTQSGAG